MKRPRASGSLWTSEQTVEIFPHFPRIFPHDYLQIHASFCIRLHEAARVAGGRRWLKPVENRASGGGNGTGVQPSPCQSSINLLALAPSCCMPLAQCVGSNWYEQVSLARASFRPREWDPSTSAGRLAPPEPFPLRDRSRRAGEGVGRTALRLPELPLLPWRTQGSAG